MTVNILNLPDFAVLLVEEDAYSYRIHARYESPPAVCPKCGEADPKVRKFGKRENVFADLPHHGKRTEIIVDRQRYQHLDCGAVFLEPLPMMSDAHDATERLVRWIGDQALRRPFAKVAADLEISERTVRRVFDDRAAELNRTYRPRAPRWLGIDEVHLMGKPRGVLTNITRRIPIELLSDNLRSTVAQCLSRLRGKERIEVVAIDMHRPYRDAANEVVPQAAVVADKWHVIKTGSVAMEGVRKRIRKGLSSRQRVQLKNDRFLLLKRAKQLKQHQQLIIEAWGAAYPDLVLAWKLKERFWAIYDTADKDEARERIRDFPHHVPKHLRSKTEFGPCITALKNWETEILAYWDHPVTNAYTESFNNRVRDVERAGRGYPRFDVLRTKLLFTPPAHIQKELETRARRAPQPEWAKSLPDGWKVVYISDELGWMVTSSTSSATDDPHALRA